MCPGSDLCRAVRGSAARSFPVAALPLRLLLCARRRWHDPERLHEDLGSELRFGPGVFRYFCTLRGETWIPSFSISSLAIRSCPQLGFSADILRINSWRLLGKRGLPVGFDFQRQNSRNPLRCQRTSVSAWTATSAPRQSNRRLSAAIIHRVESSARLGLTLRSWKRANCFRRNRFSADRALRERAINATSRPTSSRASAAVRKQCCRAVKKHSDAAMNAQDRTFY